MIMLEREANEDDAAVRWYAEETGVGDGSFEEIDDEVDEEKERCEEVSL